MYIPQRLRYLLVLFILCIFSIFSLTACSPTHGIDTEKLTTITVFYNDSENQNQTVDFDSESEQLTSVKTWLKKNKKGWEKFEDTPPFGDILITSQNLSLNIGTDWIILRHVTQTSQTSDASVKQLRKALSTEERNYFETLR